MKLKNLPVKNPKPNAARFIDCLMGRRKDGPVPLVEYIIDDVVLEPIVTDLLGRRWVQPTSDRATQAAWLDNFIEYWRRLGYDCVRFERSLPLVRKSLTAADPSRGADGRRDWVDEHVGAIRSWDDFERYPWPRVEDYDFFPFEYIAAHLPDGMGLLTCHAGGMYEHLSALLSYEGLALALYDNPELVKAVANKLGELMTAFYKHLLDLERVAAIFPGDDMGFRSGTLISPNDLRTYTLPWHKRFAAMAHANGLPYFLHSCGNLATIMADLIDDIGIDGKHSYEDAIIPVEEFQARYGGRIAVLGGVDINILAAGTPESVRRRVRSLIETCGPRGRYAVGSGNSIPSYIPVENYLAMVDEALECAAE